MKFLLAAGVLVLVSPQETSIREAEAFAVWEPEATEDPLLFLGIVERGDAAVETWGAKDIQVERIESDAGEILTPLVDPAFLGHGDKNATLPGYPELPDNEWMLVFLLEPSQPVKSIERLAGSYRVLRGGERKLVAVPTVKTRWAEPWKDEALAAEGLELEYTLRETPRIELRFRGPMEGPEFVRLVGEGADPGNENSSGFPDSDDSIWYFDFEDGVPPSLAAKVWLDGQSEPIVLPTLSSTREWVDIESKELKAHGISVSSRGTEVLEFEANGYGDSARLGALVWVDSKGKELGTRPEMAGGSIGDSFNIFCPPQRDVPKGWRLKLELHAGAVWEDGSFEYTDVRVRSD